jgi:hypothetical protein
VPVSAPPVFVPVSAPPVSVFVSDELVSWLSVLEVLPVLLVLPDFLADALAATDPSGTDRAGLTKLVGFSCTSLLPQPETAAAKAISAIAAGARSLLAEDDRRSAGISG